MRKMRLLRSALAGFGERRPTIAYLPACVAVMAIGVCGLSSAMAAPSAAAATARSTSRDAALYNELPTAIKSSGEITFGALWETPPVISVNTTNTSTPVGIAPDLAAAIVKLLGVKAVWKNMQWPAQLPGVESGNVDALFGQVSDGAAREKVVNLVDFFKSKMGMLVKGGNPDHVKSLANACGLKIGVPVGSDQEATVEGNSKKFCTSHGKPAIQPVGYPGAQGAIVAIKAGSINGWLDETFSTADIAAKSHGTFSNIVLPLSQTNAYSPPDTAIAVNRHDTALARVFAAALIKLHENGTYQKIMAKWGASSAVEPIADIKVNRYLSGK